MEEEFGHCFRTFLLGIVALLSVNVTYLWQQIIAASLALHSGHQQRATTPELCATNSDTGCPMCTARPNFLSVVLASKAKFKKFS